MLVRYFNKCTSNQNECMWVKWKGLPSELCRLRTSYSREGLSGIRFHSRLSVSYRYSVLLAALSLDSAYDLTPSRAGFSNCTGEGGLLEKARLPIDPLWLCVTHLMHGLCNSQDWSYLKKSCDKTTITL